MAALRQQGEALRNVSAGIREMGAGRREMIARTRPASAGQDIPTGQYVMDCVEIRPETLPM